MNDLIVPLILSGGVGKRLWSIPRKYKSKQFADLGFKETMFETTLSRLERMKFIESCVVVCNSGSEFIILEQLRRSKNSIMKL